MKTEKDNAKRVWKRKPAQSARTLFHDEDDEELQRTLKV